MQDITVSHLSRFSATKKENTQNIWQISGIICRPWSTFR